MQTLVLRNEEPLGPHRGWYQPLLADQTPISISDLVEIRARLDTLRVAAGLGPVEWEGASPEDRTFRAGVTPIRARHFTQLREAIADLWRVAEMGTLPEFTGGPIVAGTRPIRVTDPLDLRGWIERYEQCVPERAAESVKLYDEYTAAYPELQLSPLPIQPQSGGTPRTLLTEEWDGAGFSRYGYDDAGRLRWRLRFVDDRAYVVRYGYGSGVDVRLIEYPDARALGQRTPIVTYHYAENKLLGIDTSEGLSFSAQWQPSADDAGWVDEFRRLAGGPRSPDRRLIRDSHGTPVKIVEASTSRVWIEGSLLSPHDIGNPSGLRPLATFGWTVDAELLAWPVAYAVWSTLAAVGCLIGVFAPTAWPRTQ